jgi:ATP-dependent DNA helicase RecG
MEEEKIKKIVDELLEMPRETEWFEFKSSYFEEKLLGEYISSLANSACLKSKPFGYLIFGIEDETHTIVGTDVELKDEKIGGVPLENWLSIKFNPKIIVEIDEYFVDGKKVVVIQVPAATDEPVKFEGNAFFRIGNSKKSLKDFSEIERQIWNNDKDKNFEKEVAKLDVSQDEVLSMLDYSSYFKLTKQALPSNTEQFLEKMEQDRLVVRKLGGLYDIKNLGQ